jgi:hypothetical protein
VLLHVDEIYGYLPWKDSFCRRKVDTICKGGLSCIDSRSVGNGSSGSSGAGVVRLMSKVLRRNGDVKIALQDKPAAVHM